MARHLQQHHQHHQHHHQHHQSYRLGYRLSYGPSQGQSYGPSYGPGHGPRGRQRRRRTSGLQSLKSLLSLDPSDGDVSFLLSSSLESSPAASLMADAPPPACDISSAASHRHPPSLHHCRRRLRPGPGSLQHPARHLRSLRNLLTGDADGQSQDSLPRLRSRRRRHQGSLHLLDDCLRPDQRPSSSPDHPPKSSARYAAKHLRSSSDEHWPRVDSLSSSTLMTRAQFEALPSTIQRKYFSTLERLRFADDCHPLHHHDSASLPPALDDHLRLDFAAVSGPVSGPGPRCSPCPAAAAARLSRRRAKSPERLSTHRRRPSVMLDAADEACLRVGKRQAKAPDAEHQLHLPAAAKMQAAAAAADKSRDVATTTESMYDSFRWLEEEDELDLRLFLDDYHLNLREEVLVPTKSQSRPSFRRHLSISKLPFGGRVSGTFNRPVTKDELSPTSPSSPVLGHPGHVRRRSRALSLMTPRQASPDISTTMDPAASHYQDPDARMKLRVYLASPHKFDEAIEFGFPSIDEVQGQEPGKQHGRTASRQESPRLQTFLEDDASSMYSEASAADPESPRTPEAAEKPAARVSRDTGAGAKLDYAQAPASSREMTLRMTLTRPDLRSHEEQMYGWQRTSTGRRSQTRDELPSPQSPLPKESIERQLAALDEEELAGDGVVKRFWNRVRRT